MRRRLLPGTGLELSVLGFGCWAIGGEDWGPDVRDDEAIAALRLAWEGGVNWFDTAPAYGWGHADTLLVRALGSELDEAVVVSKVGPRRAGGRVRSELGPARVRADVEGSLRRLRREHLDLVLTHWPCEVGTPIEETVEALERLREAGRIRAWGLSNIDVAALERAAAVARPAAVQLPLSLLRREALARLVPRASALGVGVLAYEPLARGLLAGRRPPSVGFHPSDVRARDPRFQGTRHVRGWRLARDLARVGARSGSSAAALACAWVATRPGVTSAIVGMKRPGQVRDNLLAARVLDRTRILRAAEAIADLHGFGPTPRPASLARS